MPPPACAVTAWKPSALHGVEVVGERLDGDGAVHAEVGLGAVLGGRIDPDFGDFGGGGHLDLLPGMAAGVGGGLREAGWESRRSAHALMRLHMLMAQRILRSFLLQIGFHQ